MVYESLYSFSDNHMATELIPSSHWETWAIVWYVWMCVLAAFNVLALAGATSLARQSRFMDRGTQVYRSVAAGLAWPFILSVAYRCVLPTQSQNRIVWHDTILSSIFVQRIFAAIGEMCLVGQISLIASFASNQLREKQSTAFYIYISAASKLMIILACVAEGFCCAGTVLESYYWYFFSSLLWSITFVIMMPGFLVIFVAAQAVDPESILKDRGVGAFGLSWFIFCCVYLPWSAIMNLPEFWQRYSEDKMNGIPDIPVEDCFQEALTYRVPTQAWDMWHPTAWWMAGYFLLMSWASILMAFGPHMADETAASILETALEAEARERRLHEPDAGRRGAAGEFIYEAPDWDDRKPFPRAQVF